MNLRPLPKRAALLSSAFAAMALLVSSGAAPAHAAETCRSITGAKACFNPTGEVFTLYDTAPDGYSVRVQWGISGEPPKDHAYGYGWNNGGNNTYSTFNRDWPEDRKVGFFVSRYDGDSGAVFGMSNPISATT